MDFENILHALSLPIEISVIACGATAFVILSIQWYIDKAYYLRLVRYRRKNTENIDTEAVTLPPVSVIVYASDNADSLRHNIPRLFEQDYPEFEVVVVDDASIDDTREVLHWLAGQYPQLYSTYVPSDARALSRKKLALTLGLKAVKNEYVVVLDAHCVPDSLVWLRNMMRRFTSGVDVVLGYSHFSHPMTFSGRYMAYDRLLFSMRYLACAVRRRPYMGEGTNLAYRKSLFFEHKGFVKTLNFRYGDDDLFVNEVATRDNTRVEIDNDSFMSVTGDDTALMWRLQKLRYRFTASHLRGRRQPLFAVEQAGVYLFYALLAAMAVLQPMHPVVWLSIVILWLWRTIVQVMTYRLLSKAFAEPRLCWRVLLYEWARPIVNGYFWWLSYRRRDENKTWTLKKL